MMEIPAWMVPLGPLFWPLSCPPVTCATMGLVSQSLHTPKVASTKTMCEDVDQMSPYLCVSLPESESAARRVQD